MGNINSLIDVEHTFTQRQTVKRKEDIVDIEYVLNSYGCRSDEFKHENILVIGCSHTFGEGLPAEYSWPRILAKNTNKTVANLARSGDSTVTQVRYAFWYFQNFGHPETVIAFLPLLRMPFPIISKYNKRKNYGWSVDGSDYETDMYIMHNDIDLFAKAPYSLDNILHSASPLYYSNIMIELLVQYCRSHNIQLIFCSWDFGNEMSYRDLDLETIEQSYMNKYPEFVHIDQKIYNYSDSSIKPSCHQEHSEDELFFHAADRKRTMTAGGYAKPHWGLHTHIHLADFFADKLRENKKEIL